MDLKKYLNNQAAIINKALRSCLPKDNSLISRSMRYSIFAGGKRLRPILVLESAKVCGRKSSAVMPAACAVEFIHTYSLIHDDLPSMDNDDLRRGKPTNHKKFGVATAILTGDALLTDAFRLIAKCRAAGGSIIKAVAVLSEASGYTGMIGGQIKDTIETQNWNKKTKGLAKQNLVYIHQNKTAALIKASLLIGAIIAGAGKKQCKLLGSYGENIGLAFQITDDILDITADKKALGKLGSDKDNNKLTYPAIYGIEKSKQLAARYIKNARKNLINFGIKAKILQSLADYIVQRSY